MAFFRSREERQNARTRPIHKNKSLVATANGKADKNDDEEDQEDMTDKEQELTKELALAKQRIEFLETHVQTHRMHADYLQKQLSAKDEFLQKVIFELIAMKSTAAAPISTSTTADRLLAARAASKDVTKTPDVADKLPR
jgi:hypothetical protein